MSYPCIARDDKKSVKIKSGDIEKIMYLHDVEKISLNKIADIFHVNSQTIHKNYNPKINKRRNDHTNNYKKKRYKEDPAFRKKTICGVINSINKRRKIDPEFRQWEKDNYKKYYKKNNKKLNETRRINYASKLKNPKEHAQDLEKRKIIWHNNKKKYSLQRKIKYYKEKLKKIKIKKTKTQGEI